MKTLLWAGLISFFALVSCQSPEKILKVAATPIPHAELLEAVKSDLESQGITLKIVEVDDYNLPNRLVFEKQVDANFFQHLPFLNEQNERFGYHLKSLAAIHIEPLGLYSKKIDSLKSLKERATVAVPSDPTNEARALDLLEEVGLIKLKRGAASSLATVFDIEANEKNLKIQEIDAALLPRILEDVDLAVIPANFALQASLNPGKDALSLESSDSPYANILVVREGDEENDQLQKLKAALTSEKLQQLIKEKYQGALLPVSQQD